MCDEPRGAEPVPTISIVSLDEGDASGMAAACLPRLPGPLQLRARAIADAQARSRFVLCHWAVLSLARQAGGGAQVTYEPESSGRPVLIPGPWLSISRAGGHAAVGLCSAQQIGLDRASTEAEVSWPAAQRYPGLAAGIPKGGTGRLPFLKAWTELEAIAKLRQMPMQQLLMSPTLPDAHLVTFKGQGLVLTLAAERASPISIAWMGWTAEAGLELLHSQVFPGGGEGMMQPW